MKELTLKFLRDVKGSCGTRYKKDQLKRYYPWNYQWDNMSEEERVKKGIFVFCYGQGEFEVFKNGDHVKIVSEAA